MTLVLLKFERNEYLIVNISRFFLLFEMMNERAVKQDHSCDMRYSCSDY